MDMSDVDTLSQRIQQEDEERKIIERIAKQILSQWCVT